MKRKITLLQWLLIFIPLTACGPLLPQQIITPTINVSTYTPVFENPTSLPTFTPFPTFPPSPTYTPAYPTFYAQLTANVLTTPIRTPVIPIKADKIPNAYIKDGNLYFTNTASQSIQLTNSGKDHDPILSDDGRKVAFYRGETSDNIRFINSDGSNEEGIITNEIPLLIGKGEIKSPAFVPGTHILLFNTYFCNPRKGLYDYPDCTIGVYSTDTDTGKVNKVVENISGNSMRDCNFEISPDGKYVSVAEAGHINIYILSSRHFKIAYPNVVAYYITTSDEYLPNQYWLPNSNGLIIILAADQESNEPATPPALYVVFRYTIKDMRAVQILFNKFITWDPWGMGHHFSISPDRNWIFFAGNDTGDRRDASSYYLGNLKNGHTQLDQSRNGPIYSIVWSPDSRHFSSTFPIEGGIGSVDGPPVPVGGHFIEWIDATHYYYSTGNSTDTFKTYIGILDP